MDAAQEPEHAAAPAVDADEEAEHESPSPHHNPPRNVFVLAGQSNMSGRGGVRHRRWDGVVPPECRSTPAILRFSARSRWLEAREPLHADIDTAKTCGVGPGLPFANAVLPHLLPGGPSSPDPPLDSAVVGLVPCAVGGTAISEWERGTRLYEQMVRRAKEAARGGGEVRAVLWYQGESDATSLHAADAYGDNMERLILDLRADLGLPSLPFIQVAIASGEGGCMEKVRQAQLGLDLPNLVCVDAKGLPLNEDHLHLSTEAQVRLGSMLAEAYIENFVTSSMASCPPPPLMWCTCSHGYCAIKMSQTERNPGRMYYKCKNERCGFFMWYDEVKDLVAFTPNCCCGREERIRYLENRIAALEDQVEHLNSLLRRSRRIVQSLPQAFSFLSVVDDEGGSDGIAHELDNLEKVVPK